MLPDFKTPEGKKLALETAWRYQDEFRTVLRPTTPTTINPIGDFLNYLPQLLQWYYGNSIGMSLEPAHGRGHVIRNILHSIIIVKDTPLHRDDALAILLGGWCHDIFIDIKRYEERDRIGHAEVAGYILDKALKETGLWYKHPYACWSAVFSVLAHTFYMQQPRKINIGIDRYSIQPYQDTWSNGEIFQPVLGIRKIAQADCFSPFFPGRHLISLGDEHEDFDGKKFYPVKLEDHLQIFPPDENGKFQAGTMLRHLQMFEQNQSGLSIYSAWTFGSMRTITQTYIPWLKEIYTKVYQSYQTGYSGGEDNAQAVENWLIQQVSYFDGVEQIKSIIKKIKCIDDRTSTAWFNGLMLAKELSVKQVQFMREQLGEELMKILPKQLPVIGNGLLDMLSL